MAKVQLRLSVPPYPSTHANRPRLLNVGLFAWRHGFLRSHLPDYACQCGIGVARSSGGATRKRSALAGATTWVALSASAVLLTVDAVDIRGVHVDAPER